MAKDWANKEKYHPSSGVLEPRVQMPRSKASVRIVLAWGERKAAGGVAKGVKPVRPVLEPVRPVWGLQSGKFGFRARELSRFVSGGRGSVVGLESQQVVSLLGVLPLVFNTGMGGVVGLRWRGGKIHGSPFVVLVLLQEEKGGFLGVVTEVVFVVVVLVGKMVSCVLTPLSSKWLGTGFTLLVLTPALSRLFAHVLVFEFQVGDLKNIWLINSDCSRHMTGDRGWFSSLVPVVTKRYITFGDNGRGRVLSEGEIKVSDKITLRRVALLQSLGYNLLSVSQLLDEGFEVSFRPGGSRILDSRGDLVCMVIPKGQVFRAEFSQSSGVERCFLAGSSSELWKWHRKMGHLSFDLLSRLSKLNFVRGLPRLRLEKELICAPCRHAKMVVSSHPPLTDVMTERPCELLHMDLVGPARVRSAGGKWYVPVVVDDYSRYAWVFFLKGKRETFGFVRDLVLRLRNERHGDAIQAIRSDNGSARWLGRCLMSIGLRGGIGLRQ
jgi:hypothetical protein